jgi:hypothetical protein
MTKMKRKVFWIAFLVLGIIITFALSSKHTFRAVSWDIHIQADADGNLINYLLTTWNSSDSIVILETEASYSSLENARNALEKKLENYGAIIERKKKPGYLSDVDERIIATTNNPKAKDTAVTLIKLRNNKIYYWQASSLENVLAFEKSWIKLDW